MLCDVRILYYVDVNSLVALVPMDYRLSYVAACEHAISGLPYGSPTIFYGYILLSALFSTLHNVGPFSPSRFLYEPR